MTTPPLSIGPPRQTGPLDVSQGGSYRSGEEQRVLNVLDMIDSARSGAAGSQLLLDTISLPDERAPGQQVSIAHLKAVAELLFFAGANDVERFQSSRLKVRSCPAARRDMWTTPAWQC